MSGHLGYEFPISCLRDALHQAFIIPPLPIMSISTITAPSVFSTIVLGLLFLGACGEGEKTSEGVTSSIGGSIQLRSASNALTVERGSSSEFILEVSRANYSGAVTLSAEPTPAGVLVTFSPPTLVASTSSAVASVSVGASAQSGSHDFSIVAKGDRSAITARLAVTLDIPAPSFRLQTGPTPPSVAQGLTTSLPVSVTRSGGFSDSVSLRVDGIPPNVAATFSPAVIAPTSSVSTLQLSAQPSAIVGVYPITIVASAASSSAQSISTSLTIKEAPSISLSLATSGFAVKAGQSSSGVAVLTRGGGFSGSVALSVSGLPSGISATLSPTSLSGSIDRSTITIAVAPSVPTGNYILTLTGIASGVQPAAVSFPLSVTSTPGFSMSVDRSSMTVMRSPGTYFGNTLRIVRTGGYLGAITLAFEGLPSGVTASAQPNGSGLLNESQILITAANNAVIGTTTVVITASGAGLAEPVRTSFQLTVQGVGGTGPEDVVWSFCRLDRIPQWFAVRDGVAGAWVTIQPTTASNMQSYRFKTATVGGVAYALVKQDGSTDVSVHYLSQVEMAYAGEQECRSFPVSNTLRGSLAGLAQTSASSQRATIAVGGASVSTAANGAFELLAPWGISNLLAYRTSTNTLGGQAVATPDRVVLRRRVGYTETIPLIDFSSEGHEPASARYSILNLGTEQILPATTTFQTVDGVAGSILSADIGGAQSVAYGPPNFMLQPTDLHQVVVGAAGVGTTRMYGAIVARLADQTAVLGAQPPVIQPNSTGVSPFLRLSVSGQWPSDYPDRASIRYAQGLRSWTITISRRYTGSEAAAWTMEMPDFSSTAGFQNSWGLARGAVEWTWTSTGIVSGFDSVTGQFGDGGLWRSASRTGTSNF